MRKFVLILLIYPCVVIHATNIDSLRHIAEKSRQARDWNQVALYYEETGDTTQLRICAQKAYHLSLSENNPDEQGEALSRMSTYYEYMGDLTTAMEKSVWARECFRKRGDLALIAFATSNIAYYYMETGRYDEAIEAYHEAIDLSNRSDNPDKERDLAQALINISLLYSEKGFHDSCRLYNRKGRDIAYVLKDTAILIETYNQMGILNSRQFRYREALRNYEEALRLQLLKKDLRHIPYAYVNIAMLYADWGNFDLALNFAHKAEQSAKDCGDLMIYAKILSQVSAIFAKSERYPEAIATARKSLALSQDYPISYYNSLDLLAISYYMLGKPDSSEIYLSKMKAYIEAGHQVKTTRFYDTKGKILIHQGKFREAIPFLEKSLELRQSGDVYLDKMSIQLYERASKAYEKGAKNYEKALYYKQLQLDLSDSIYRAEHTDAMADFNVRYGVYEKELEITRLKLQEEELLRTRTLIVIGLVVLAIILLVAWLYILVLRWKKKAETAEWEKKVEAKDTEYNTVVAEMEKKQLQSYLEGLETERTRLAKEMHDHISNDLLALEIKMQSAGVPGELIVLAHGMHSQVRDMSHALIPPVFQYASLSEIVDEYVREQNTLNGPCFQFYVVPEEGWEGLPHQMALDLYRIVQETCSNALKHAHAKNIVISLTRKGDCIELSVTDDGRGIQPSVAIRGIGMQTIEERAANQRGTVSVDSMPGKGTTVRVTIPA